MQTLLLLLLLLDALLLLLLIVLAQLSTNCLSQNASDRTATIDTNGAAPLPLPSGFAAVVQQLTM